MLTRAGTAMAVLATGLITGGLVLAAPIVLALGALPFLVLGVGLALPAPRLTMAEVICPAKARAGDVVTVHAQVVIRGHGGTSLVVVHVPPEFEIVDGSNVRAMTGSTGRTPLTWSFDVRAARRGAFEIGPVLHDGTPALALRSGDHGVAGSPVELEVHPKVVPVRRLRRMRGSARHIAPEEDVARLGLQTTDFREIRQYQWGDPPRSVNWKATARLGPGAAFPLVNEYEVEGRKGVFLYLDGGPGLMVGTSVWNGFEAALGAASGVSLALLDRGFKVGFHAYNSPGSEPVYPDVGTKQFLKINKRRARLEASRERAPFNEAVEATRAWVAHETPMVIVITRPELDPVGLEAGIKRLQRFSVGRRRPILIIAPQVHRLIPAVHERGGDAARLLTAGTQDVHARLRRLGAAVIPWDPSTQKLETLLMRGVLPT